MAAHCFVQRCFIMQSIYGMIIKRLISVSTAVGPLRAERRRREARRQICATPGLVTARRSIQYSKMLKMFIGMMFEQGDDDLLQMSGEMGDAMRYLENMDRSYYGQVRPRWEIQNTSKKNKWFLHTVIP